MPAALCAPGERYNPLSSKWTGRERAAESGLGTCTRKTILCGSCPAALQPPQLNLWGLGRALPAASGRKRLLSVSKR
jgi:hypothetical protein